MLTRARITGLHFLQHAILERESTWRFLGKRSEALGRREREEELEIVAVQREGGIYSRWEAGRTGYQTTSYGDGITTQTLLYHLFPYPNKKKRDQAVRDSNIILFWKHVRGCPFSLFFCRKKQKVHVDGDFTAIEKK